MIVPYTVDFRNDFSTTFSRWNFYGRWFDRILVCKSTKEPTLLFDASGKVLQMWDIATDALEWMSQQNNPGQLWVGYLSYDLGRVFEVLPEAAQDDLGLPIFIFVRMSEMTVGGTKPATPPLAGAHAVYSNFSAQQYQQAVQKSIEYIKAGDIFQVNLSQRLSVKTESSPQTIFEELCRQSPAPFSALLEFDQFALVSHSPELFFSIDVQEDGSRKIVNRPIKGTRRRLVGMDVELEQSEKDKAELAMIVDLQRNDLGRVCEIGSVKVTQPRVIETQAAVYHGVATVEGVLRSDVDFFDILRAIFPCGSIAGCPKIRAMEIIEEIEPVRRGPYCGAIGYLASDGSMHFSVAIRTMIIKDGIAHLPVGGGIVADSVPEQEYEETLVKAHAMLKALRADQLPILSDVLTKQV